MSGVVAGAQAAARYVALSTTVGAASMVKCLIAEQEGRYRQLMIAGTDLLVAEVNKWLVQSRCKASPAV